MPAQEKFVFYEDCDRECVDQCPVHAIESVREKQLPEGEMRPLLLGTVMSKTSEVLHGYHCKECKMSTHLKRSTSFTGD